MSRIGKIPIDIPEKVELELDGGVVVVKGPRGELRQEMHPKVALEIEGAQARVSVANPEIKEERALWGLFSSLIRNMVTGVTEGFEKRLEFEGVGYKVAVAGKKLTMHLGFSHPVEVEIPDGYEVKVDKNVISISGIDKQGVGELAASIRAKRKTEPYKGKGIRYEGEYVRRKQGKALKGTES